jgi:hypothetical protein
VGVRDHRKRVPGRPRTSAWKGRSHVGGSDSMTTLKTRAGSNLSDSGSKILAPIFLVPQYFLNHTRSSYVKTLMSWLLLSQKILWHHIFGYQKILWYKSSRRKRIWYNKSQLINVFTYPPCREILQLPLFPKRLFQHTLSSTSGNRDSNN